MTNLFGEPTCTKGWERRCAEARSLKCTCGCGGKNHGIKATKPMPAPKKKLPVPSMDDVLLAGKIFVFVMLDTNAETATFTQNDFKGPDGTNYGSFKITVKKL